MGKNAHGNHGDPNGSLGKIELLKLKRQIRLWGTFIWDLLGKESTLGMGAKLPN